jgi:hypothetical protein
MKQKSQGKEKLIIYRVIDNKKTNKHTTYSEYLIFN